MSARTHLGLELLDAGGRVRPVADAQDGVEDECARAGLGGRGAIAALEVFPTVRCVRQQLAILGAPQYALSCNHQTLSSVETREERIALISSFQLIVLTALSVGQNELCKY